MQTFHQFIGSDAQTIVWWQMICRGTLIFFYTLVLVRFGGRRIFGKYTSFDIVLGVILGSIMSRALTGNAAFFPTLAAATALVFLHRLLAELSFRCHRIGHFVKGTEELLVQNGTPQADAMRRTQITEHDLAESLRSHGKEDVGEIKAAYLERSGQISVISK